MPWQQDIQQIEVTGTLERSDILLMKQMSRQVEIERLLNQKPNETEFMRNIRVELDKDANNELTVSEKCVSMLQDYRADCIENELDGQQRVRENYLETKF